MPLVQRAGELWDRLSLDFNKRILVRNGLLTMGPEDSEAIRGIARCANMRQLDIERLSALEVRYRFPVFQILDEFTGLLEHSAGWIDVDAAIKAMHELASTQEAELRFDEPVDDWINRDAAITVRTRRREIIARRLIITAGAWVTQILSNWGLPTRILRKTFFWFDPAYAKGFGDQEIPIFGLPPNSFTAFLIWAAKKSKWRSITG